MPSSHKFPSSSDVIDPRISLYIEGVQVPFIAMSINQSYGGLPSASIQVPIYTGLNDIARFYNPKVHVFFFDPFYEKDCLLFQGVISSVSYSKSVGFGASTDITFQCVHKSAQLSDMTMRFGGFSNIATGTISTPDPQDSATLLPQLGSSDSYLQALKGIDDTLTNAVSSKTPSGDPRAVPDFLSGHYDRLQGLPGTLLNLWNQITSSIYSKPDINEAGLLLYIPLIEKGLRFFQRLSGHPFIEKLTEEHRENPCPGRATSPGKVLIPPAMHIFLHGATQAALSAQKIAQSMSPTGEYTALLQFFVQFMDSLEYDFITLASPAKAEWDPIETVVKPRMPSHFAPMCNILFPNMFYGINVNEETFQSPSRIVVMEDVNSSIAADPLYVRGPASVREAISDTGTGKHSLADSLTYSKDRVGKYEQARGIKPTSIVLPRWMSMMQQNAGTTDVNANQSSFNKQALEDMKKAWDERYPGKPDLNIWGDGGAELDNFHKLVIEAADYEHSQRVLSTRVGQVEGVFNPYIVAGYPMDILDNSPFHPSYHAFCTSVTHSITSSSISTTIAFTHAMSYSELSNYYMPPLSSWLREVMGFTKRQSIVANEDGASKAHEFYKPVFGVGAAVPDEVFNFKENVAKTVERKRDDKGYSTSAGTSNYVDGFEKNPNLSVYGNLYMVRREIESKEDVESKYGIKFIKVDSKAEKPTMIRFKAGDQTKASTLMEMGQSEFLSYKEIKHKEIKG